MEMLGFGIGIGIGFKQPEYRTSKSSRVIDKNLNREGEGIRSEAVAMGH